ncbi:hypothetical protein M422DRAFT_272409 [Sphaerobolus stellatus SS14]|uniref:Uncharacterized protein n=1 Tax=Sphaerobolus stellatus (strain SS14) TaxID=990650 RepID=A0A0C9TBN2_SPHS4|nr:hypothetical protein M422DRAFT_272409 [Sphaerobolus stellatus SS14]
MSTKNKRKATDKLIAPEKRVQNIPPIAPGLHSHTASKSMIADSFGAGMEHIRSHADRAPYVDVPPLNRDRPANINTEVKLVTVAQMLVALQDAPSVKLRSAMLIKLVELDVYLLRLEQCTEMPQKLGNVFHASKQPESHVCQEIPVPDLRIPGNALLVYTWSLHANTLEKSINPLIKGISEIVGTTHANFSPERVSSF